VDQGGDERPNEVIAIRLYGPNELARIESCGFYERSNLSLLFRCKCQTRGCFLTVGHMIHPAIGRCSVAMVEAFHATGTVPAEH
jgi:hypothetical protein